MNDVLLLAQGTHDPSETISYVVMALYIAAFSLFIYGLMGLTGPKTAVRGNWIAAVGMGLAVAATLLFVWNQGAVAEAGSHGRDDVPAINWILIAARPDHRCGPRHPACPQDQDDGDAAVGRAV